MKHNLKPQVKADPKKPIKSAAGLFATIFAMVVTTGLPLWASVLITAVAVGVVVYAVPNPLVHKKIPAERVDEDYLF